MRIQNLKLKTLTKNITHDAIVIEFSKGIAHEDLDKITEFISQYISKLENYHIITAVQCNGSYCWKRNYALYQYEIEKVISEAQKDLTCNINRLYLFEDNQDRLIYKEILTTELPICN